MPRPAQTSVQDPVIASSAELLATVVRGGAVESVHHGHLIARDADGAVLVRSGDPGLDVFARSSLKPLQAVAMLQAGLELDGPLLALACASHSGEQVHRDGALEVLLAAGLAESDLQNTADLPLDEQVAAQWSAQGLAPSSLAQNCSGKHAAMLATCVAAGWDTAGYLDTAHPLQQVVRSTIEELTGDTAQHVSVDGCGAPLFSCTLAGLARAFGSIARAGADAAAGRLDTADPLARVGRAMSANPHMVGGTGRDVTALIAGVPGLVAKDGAEGVYAVGLPDGRGAALKILDGSQRARPVVMAAVLRALGVDAPVLDEVGHVAVLGHGRPVGSIEAAQLGLG